MKETRAASKALRARAEQLINAAKALEGLDEFASTHEYNYHKPVKRKLTAQARKRISQAQKKRWQLFHGGKKKAA